MFDAAELVGDVAPHAHCRRVGVGILGVLRFEVLQFAQKRVEFEIGYDWRGLNIVFVIVIVETFAQEYYSLPCSHNTGAIES